MVFVSKLFALSSLLCLASAFELKGKVQWNSYCSGLKELGPSKVLLDNGRHSGGVTKDGSFTIHDVADGTYVLSVESHDHPFDQLRIDVYNATGVVEVRPFIPGTPLNPPSTVTLPYPILLTPKKRHEYYVPVESFNLVGMFQSPMMLMMVFAGGMMFAMPYITSSLDPEMMKDINQRQAKMASIQDSVSSGDFKSGLATLLTQDEPHPETKASGATPSKKGSKPNKRR